jgi:hypothetical protein
MDAAGELVGPFLIAFDRVAGSFSALDQAGAGSQPVWKGR